MSSYTASPSFAIGSTAIIPFTFNALLGDVSAVSINSIATVLTPATGKTLQLLGGSISVSADASVLFEDNSAASANFVYRTPLLLAKYPYDFVCVKTLSGVDRVLKATGSASASITGILWYANV